MKAKRTPRNTVNTRLTLSLIQIMMFSLISIIGFGQQESNDSYPGEDANTSPLFNDPNDDPLHISFNVEASERDALIEWRILLDVDHYQFTIERSLEGNQWEAMHQTESVENLTEQNLYSWRDSNPYKSVSYYRLKVVDGEGYIHYSPMKSFNFNEVIETSELLVYPNPVISNLTVEGNESELEELTVLNELGEDVSSIVRVVVTNTNVLKIDVSALPQGNFHLRTSTNLVRVSKVE